MLKDTKLVPPTLGLLFLVSLLATHAYHHNRDTASSSSPTYQHDPVYRPALDEARSETSIDPLWSGTPSFDGQGVLVGIVDTGIDVNHPDFTDPETGSRIVGIFDRGDPTGPPPPGFVTGTYYTEQDIRDDLVSQTDENGHGSILAGIAAGNGASSKGLYQGAAPASQILVAKVSQDAEGSMPEAWVVDGVRFLVEEAERRGQPIAICLGFQSQMGPHDGGTSLEQVIEDLTGPGIIFCAPAGNQGNASVSDQASASTGDFTLSVQSYTPTPGTGQDFFAVGIWVKDTGSPSVRIRSPFGFVSPTFGPGSQTTTETVDGRLFVANPAGTNPLNGDQLILIQVDDEAGDAPGSGNWTFEMSGGSGSASAWVYDASMFVAFPESDNSVSMAQPATSPSVVAVAGYKTRNDWPSKTGTTSYPPLSDLGQTDLGDLAPFSGRGPTADGREKPDLAAPATMIGVASGDATDPFGVDRQLPSGSYVAYEGTSLSAALVTGTLALMLQKNPLLQPQEAIAILRSTARADSFANHGFSPTFGEGKLDALAAVTRVPFGLGGPGDLNFDGSLTVSDLTQMVNFVVDPEGHPLFGDARLRADIYPAESGDGFVNASDLARLANLISNVPDTPETLLESVAVSLRQNSPFEFECQFSGAAVRSGQFELIGSNRWEDVVVTSDSDISFETRVLEDRLRVVWVSIQEAPNAVQFKVQAQGQKHARMTNPWLADNQGHRLSILADTFEPNDTLEEAYGPLQPAVTVDSFIGVEGDKDYYYLDAQATFLTITLTQIPEGADYDVFVVDDQDNILFFSDRPSTLDEDIDVALGTEGRYWIRVEAVASEILFSDTDAYLLTATFDPANQPPKVTLLAPNQGTFPEGSQTEVLWTASDPEGGLLNYTVEFSGDNGSSWLNLSTQTDTSFVWTIQEAPTDSALIRVTAVDPGNESDSDVSDALLVITPNASPVVTLQSPQPSDTLIVGKEITVTYTASDAEDLSNLSIDIDFSDDNGGSWTSLTSGDSNSGSFAWVVDSAPTLLGLIRVTATDSGGKAGAAVLASPLVVIENPFLGTASLSLPSSQTGLAGERLTLPLTLENSASVETIEFSIALDPNRWQLPSVVLAGQGAGSTLEQSLENGILDVAILASTPIPSGKGVVAQLQLVPAFGASGQQTLALSELRILGDDQLPFEATSLPETVSITQRTPVLNLNLVASLTAAAGDTVSLPLQFDSNVEISALQFALAYNRLTLEPIDLEIGSFLTAGPTVTHNDGAGGTWNFSAFYPGGGFLSPGGGPVASLRFVVLEDAPGNGDLKFVTAEAANPEGLTLEVNTTTSDVVPVTLLYFLGESVDSGIRLTWAFGQDTPLALELERSSPRQAPERFSLDPQAEAFFDTSAEPGIVYTYRLFARDRNGKLEAFGPVEGRFEPNSRITLLSANPFQHSVDALLVGVEKAVLMDVRGRLVREFHTSGASSRIHWDGSDRNGKTVPAGVYFLRVAGEGTNQTTRLVKLP